MRRGSWKGQQRPSEAAALVGGTQHSQSTALGPPRDTKLAGDTPPSSVGSCEGKRDAAQRLQDVLEQGRSTCTGLRSELWGRWRITSPPAPGPLLLTITHSFRTEAQKGVKKK